MFGLPPDLLILLFICLLAAAGFEFVNGFHDTANAVATVIYTNSLKPQYAVILSGACNFLGVFLGGISVAMGIVYLLPVELLTDSHTEHSLAMSLSLLLSAIVWNLGTWYYGLPASSSHTLIGSILGVGIAASFIPEYAGLTPNWGKATEIGLSLIISPLFGFSVTIILMFLIKRLAKNDLLFKEPSKKQPPPNWIRGTLIGTCMGVSLAHGSNDGQKGVGLIMLILISLVPAHFALKADKDITLMRPVLVSLERSLGEVDTPKLTEKERDAYDKALLKLKHLQTILSSTQAGAPLAAKPQDIRSDILLVSNSTNKVLKSEFLSLSPNSVSSIKSDIEKLKGYTDFAPDWVLVLVSISLGLGTMIGWKRIVKTIGEKIGKQHLTYAQGASAELVAMSTFGLATGLGLPVSTTHVLSSGIAGSMVANKGIKNLQPQTVRNIVLAWILTLPVTILLSGSMFVLFRWIL